MNLDNFDELHTDLIIEDMDFTTSLGNGNILIPNGTNDYEELFNKPKLNGKIIIGDHDAEYYGIKSPSESDITYTDEEGSSEKLGGWEVGEKADKMTFQEFAYKLLHRYYAAIANLSLDPSKYIYEINVDSITSIKLKANITKKTNPIKSVKFFVNNTQVYEITDRISGGGNVEYVYTPNTPIDSDSNFKVAVDDGRNGASASTNIVFVPKSYYGFVDDVSNLTESVITGLQNSFLSTSKSFTYNNISCVNKSIVYAYRASLGNLSSILDGNGFQYISSYTKTNVTINGVLYNVYYLTNKVTVNGYKQTFA